MKYETLKEISDFIFALIAVNVFFWFFLLIALAIKLDTKGPILFKQKRIGKNKKLFVFYKFRSMRIDAPKDTPTHLLAKPDLYITNIGKLLRRSSLDETPQLWNILKGDISIIGPRPALWNQYDLIEEREKYGVNRIKPGLTGWAQINGRDELNIELKAKYDGDYLENIGLIMDFRCFFDSFIYVLRTDGIIEGKKEK
jgi:O-antigen biosynthesis protein WbqP